MGAPLKDKQDSERYDKIRAVVRDAIETRCSTCSLDDEHDRAYTIAVVMGALVRAGILR